MTSSSSTILSYLRFRAFFVVKNVSSNHEDHEGHEGVGYS